MARTRAQAQAAKSEVKPASKSKKQEEAKSESKPKATEKQDTKSHKATKPVGSKRLHEEDKGDPKVRAKPKATKKPKALNTEEQKLASMSNPKLAALLSKYGAIPLQQTQLPDPLRPHPETILAHVFNAMLTSTRISHELAAKSIACLIEAGYYDITTLKNSSWQERTEVLTKGGYTHYREKTATMLGELADLILDKYGKTKIWRLYSIRNTCNANTPLLIDGDLNNILKQTDSSPPKIRAALKEIKGIGEVGLDIFYDTAQGVWPCLAPFIDPRSQKTVEQLALGSMEQLWQEVGKDAMEMCKLTSALTTVRLDNKVKEFTE